MIKEYLDKQGADAIIGSINTVDGRPPIYLGTSTNAANTYAKTATVATFPLVGGDGTDAGYPRTGTIVGIKWGVTNTYKTSGHTYSLNVNGTGAFPIYYSDTTLATSTTANTLVAGTINRYSYFVFDGANWVWLSNSMDSNSTYSAITTSEINTGTATTSRSVTAKVLRDNFYTESETNSLLGTKANTADLAAVATSGAYSDLSGTPTIPSAPGTLDTTATTTQSTSASESLSGAITLHKVAKTGKYGDLINTPVIPAAPGTLNTNNSTAQTVSSSEALSGTIKLHKIAKTGAYSDLIGAPTGLATESYVNTAIAGLVDSAPGTLDTLNELATALGNDPNFATTIATALGNKADSADLAAVATSGAYSDLSGTPTIPTVGTLDTTATTTQSTSASESLSGAVTLHKVAKTGKYGDLINTPVIPAAPGTLVTNKTTAQTASSGEAMSGTINLHKIAKTGTYSDLIGKPTIPSAPGTLNTTATTAQSTAASEALSGSITLHKVAKTGTYSDLIGTPSLATVATSGDYGDLDNTPTIPAAPGTLNTNNTSAQTVPTTAEALSGAIKLHKVSKTGSYSDLNNKPTIPSAPGTLDTNNSTAQTVPTTAEALSGSIKLHKVAKTGTYSDLIGTPTIPAAPGTLNTTATTAQSTAASEALSGSITLHKVSKTGSYNDLLNKPTIPTVNNATLTIQKEGTTVKTFTANASSNVTCNIVETDPVFSASAAAGITSTNITNWNDAKNTAKLNQVGSSNMSLPLIVAPSGTGDGSVSELNYVPGVSYNPSTDILSFTNSTTGTISFGTGNNAASIGATSYSGRATGTETLFASDDDALTDGASKIGYYDENTETPTTVHAALLDLYDSIPTIPSLSKGTTSGSGNAVTDISVSGHTITLTKGTTFISTAGSGLTKTGSSLGHSNSVVSPTTEEFRTFKYDAQGHISAATAADEIDFTSFNAVTLSAGFLSRCAYNYVNGTSIEESIVDMGHSNSLSPYKTIPYRTVTPSTDPQGGIKK